MQNFLIKVCGMRDPENIREVSNLGIQAMGFIFYPKSGRYVDPSAFPVLNLPSEMLKVGVFVNESTDMIQSICERIGLNTVQLHGEETPKMAQRLKDSGLTVFKAFGIHNEFDFSISNAFDGVVDYLLFDTKTTQYGGSGNRYSWEYLQHYKGNIPFLLSGGIRPEHVEDISAFQHPLWRGIDLNSGFETSPAVKDVSTLRTFLQEIKENKSA